MKLIELHTEEQEILINPNQITRILPPPEEGLLTLLYTSDGQETIVVEDKQTIIDSIAAACG